MAHVEGDVALDWLTLLFLPGLGSVTLSRLASKFNNPADIFLLKDKQGYFSPKLADLLADKVQVAKSRLRAEQELANLKRKKISLLFLADENYPASLQNLPAPPAILFYQGDISCLQNNCIAIVGTRKPTSYGKNVSIHLAKGLSENGLVVVSGVAAGIDGHAHRSVINVNGKTVGVLGCGIDVVYPWEHLSLYKEIRENGVLLSEYPCGTSPDKFRFPARNRIISGLSLGVVVVEAARRSGSLITAKLALEQGKEVFAVPGRMDSDLSDGTHLLIQQGACLVNSVDDIVNELSFNLGFNQVKRPESNLDMHNLNDVQEKIFAVLEVYPKDVDTIVRDSGLTGDVVLDILLQLELVGLVRKLPGQMYEKIVSG